MSQKSVPCIKTASGALIPITKICQIYVEVDPPLTNLVGQVNVKAEVGDRDDCGALLFNPNQYEHRKYYGAMYAENGAMYAENGATLHTELIATKCYEINDVFNHDECCLFLYGSDTFKKVPDPETLRATRKRVHDWLMDQVRPEVEKLCNDIKSKLPVKPEVIEFKLK